LDEVAQQGTGSVSGCCGEWPLLVEVVGGCNSTAHNCLLLILIKSEILHQLQSSL